MTRFGSIGAAVLSALLGFFGMAVPALGEPASSRSAAIDAPLALQGYDPVAYFVGGKARKGRKTLLIEHEGVVYLFASEHNRRLFAEDPEKYRPQYGGHCAWAVGRGYLAPGSPLHWQIVDGRLYLNYNGSVARRWERDQRGLIASGDRNWPRLSRRSGGY